MRETLHSQMIDKHRVRFTGRGGEYFRVWLVNVLMSALTLGLYTPIARRRTARYFYDHTEIAGSPLEFVAPLRKMVLSFVLFVLLYIAYQIAQKSGQATAVNLFILAAALFAPYLWGSAMRFRLASTRWRGLQLHFSARWTEVYLASWPIFLLAALWIAVTFGLRLLDPPGATHPPGAPQLPGVSFTAAQWGLLAAGVILSVLCIIRTEFNYKSLLVLRGGIGRQPGRWKPVYGDFVRIWLLTLGVFLLGVAVVAVVAVVIGASLGLSLTTTRPAAPQQMVLLILLGGLGVLIGIFIATAPARAYREARLFQLIWNNIGLSKIARFKCKLQAGAYVRLRMKNLLLTALTLGLYRPFARVSEYRMKADSVSLYVKGGLDQLIGQLVHQQGGLADALADAAGLDLIG